MANKIYTNHTLAEYKKKYGNNKNLKKINKADTISNKSLLNGKSWWLIDDTYYEIPNNKVKVWWSNLGKGGQIALCALLGAGVTTAIVVPTVIAVNKKGESKKDVEIDSSVKQHIKNCEMKEVGNNYEISFTVESGYEITGIEKITINGQEFKDFTFKDGKVIIAKEALNKISGKIIVTPKIKEIIPPAIKLKEIKIAQNPNTTDYYYKDKLDLTGLKIEAVYDDGSTKDITNDSELILDIEKDHQFTKEELGQEKTITATYKEKTASFKINIIAFEDYLELFEEFKEIEIKKDAKKSGKYPKNLVIPKSLYSSIKQQEIDIETIDDFTNLGNLETVDLSESTSLKTIGIYNYPGFAGCTKLKRITLNEGLEKIGDSATGIFSGCTSLEEITIPSSVNYMAGDNYEESNFYNCINLKTVTIDSSIVANFNKYEFGQEYTRDEDISIYHNANTVYVKNGITLNDDSYIAKNFTKQDTSDKPGYDKWVRN